MSTDIVFDIDTDVGCRRLGDWDARYWTIIIIGPDIETDIGCHQILCPILILISCVAGPDIVIIDIGSDIEPDIGYVVYDISDCGPSVGNMVTRYRVAPDISTNIGVSVTRYWVSSDMSRYRVTPKPDIRYRDM